MMENINALKKVNAVNQKKVAVRKGNVVTKKEHALKMVNAQKERNAVKSLVHVKRNVQRNILVTRPSLTVQLQNNIS